VDDVKFRDQLLDEFNIEIAGGIGPLKGKIWRLGMMGYCAQRANVLLLLAAMESVLTAQSARVPAGAGVAAAVRSYTEAETAVAAAKH
jgi:alanine-glyoxylate transaminase / serine-glyoxylate transaminase / serine-pyruvate transaminase